MIKSFTIAIMLLSCMVFPSNNYVFYGGDLRYTSGGMQCVRNGSVSDARVYDDFDLSATTTIRGIWANVLTFLVPRNAYYEIRSGVSEHNGGTLHASGEVFVRFMKTGRTAFNYTEYHIRSAIPEITLPAGRYHMTLAPIGFGAGGSFWNLTLGEDHPDPGDPNPPPAGTPMGNGNSFFDSTYFGANFDKTGDLMGSGNWDFSIGVGELDTFARTLSLSDSFAITRGVGTGGDLYELWGQDDNRLVVQQRYPSNISGPSVQVVAETATLVPDNPGGNRLTLTVEARCTGFPSNRLVERIEVFDFQQQNWTIVSEQSPSTTDRQTVITRHGRYVEPGTNKLKARVSWFDRGTASLNWSGQIDWMLWDISP